MGQLLHRCHVPIGKKHPQWSYNAVIYELNVRQFSNEGSFKAVELDLLRLKGLGVDIIWFMPIFPIGELRRKGTLGSYYSIRDYGAVNPEFGTLEQFKHLVEAIHKLDMRLILDWVPNHTSRDAVWVENHPEWYEVDKQTGEIATPFDWSDTAKLDYSNPQMRSAMQEAMIFWLKECLVDGFRVDMAMLVPMDFWNATTPKLEAVRDDVFMLAEAEGPEFHERAFDATYGWQLHHLMVDIAQGKANADTLRARIMTDSMAYTPRSMQMLFTSNHDENSWKGSEFERMGGAVRNMTILSFILPGIPMIYNGQEVAVDQKLEFFDKDAIKWNEDNDFTDLYRELIVLRHTHPALGSGEQGGDLYCIDNTESWRVFAVKRKVRNRVVIALFNLSNCDLHTEFYDGDFAGDYRQIGSSDVAHLSSAARFFIPANGAFVYYK